MQKPRKTLADYIVVAISPILVMLLVGSLAFFLIQVFYRGAMVHGIRWLMFWFVLAIVLVARIGIEQGRGHARFYGIALAAATWLYLAHTHGTFFFGALLLAITWWCAHQLTLDCTLIREDEDASGQGVLQALWSTVKESVIPPEPKLQPFLLSPLDAMVIQSMAKRTVDKPPRPPGRTVVFFSLAALPLFGIGQLFLPANDSRARSVGFGFLALYLTAALGLLATTSFLGLRRYLRQRSAEMPTNVALAWLKFAAFLTTGVLLLALILPRPGAHTLKELTYRIANKPHKASSHALPYNPPGEGEGNPARLPPERNQRSVNPRSNTSGPGGASRSDARTQSGPQGAADQTARSNGETGSSGTRGNHGANGKNGANAGSNDGTVAPSSRTLKLKDVVPTGEDDHDSRGKDQAASAGESGDSDRDGPGNRIAAEPSGNRDRLKANSPVTPSAEPSRTPAVRQPGNPSAPERQSGSGRSERRASDFLARLLRALVVIAIAIVLLWLTIRYRKVIADMVRSVITAVREFFRKLFSWRRRELQPHDSLAQPAPQVQRFAFYENPFLTGKDRIWSADRLLCYTYEAVTAWATEHRIEIRAQETPREFCLRLVERFPEAGPEMEQFARYYTYEAFAKRLPDDFETDSIRHLWQSLGSVG